MLKAIHMRYNVVSVFTLQPGWINDSISNPVSPFTDSHTNLLTCVTGVNYTNSRKPVSGLYFQSLSLANILIINAVLPPNVHHYTRIRIREILTV